MHGQRNIKLWVLSCGLASCHLPEAQNLQTVPRLKKSAHVLLRFIPKRLNKAIP